MRKFVYNYQRRKEHERVQREHPNRKRLTKEQREARQARLDYQKKKAQQSENT